MLTALDEVLRTICSERPMLLVVDDLQWADNASLDFLAYVLAGLGGQRLGLLLAFRDEDRRGRDALEQWLADTSRMPDVQQVLLERLDRDDTERLCRRCSTGPRHPSWPATCLSGPAATPFHRAAGAPSGA